MCDKFEKVNITVKILILIESHIDMYMQSLEQDKQIWDILLLESFIYSHFDTYQAFDHLHYPILHIPLISHVSFS